MGAGMIVCGMVTDRMGRRNPASKWTTAIVFAVLTLVLLGSAFVMKPTGFQLLLIAVGCFFAAGTTGPTGAMVARLTHESIRATAFGTYTFFNNLLGLAAGPIVTGALADRLGLENAMRYVPLVSVLAIVALVAGSRAYPSSLRKLDAPPAGSRRIGMSSGPGTVFVTVPGLRGHVEQHWQTRLAARRPTCSRCRRWDATTPAWTIGSPPSRRPSRWPADPSSSWRTAPACSPPCTGRPVPARPT
ncbi:MFS transporter [Catellatospora coxensis]